MFMIILWLFMAMWVIQFYHINKNWDKMEKAFDAWEQEQIEKIREGR